TPSNLPNTGSTNTCAKNYIGDIGLLVAKVGEGQVKGYHLYVGGGFAEQRALGREVLREVPAAEMPQVLERLLRAYLDGRTSAEEAFHDFAKRQTPEALRAAAQGRRVAA